MTEKISQNHVLPLPQLIKGAKEHFKSLQYSASSIEFYLLAWKKLLKYAKETDVEYFSMEFAKEFLQKQYGVIIGTKIPPQKARAMRAIQVLSDFQLHGVMYKAKRDKNVLWPKQFENVFCSFLKKNSEIVSESTFRRTRWVLENFANYLNHNSVDNFSDVDVKHIYGFIESLTKYANKTVAGSVSRLRAVFEYAYTTGHHSKNLSSAVPSIKFNSKSNIPSTYTSDEVQRLLNSVDRGNPIGKRDYAILILVAKLGIRAGDIRGLKFEHLKWETNRIEFTQTKTKQLLSLPILEDVGWALIEYLKYGRPKSESQNIFIRHRAPFNAFDLGNTFRKMVIKYLRIAKISVKTDRKHGLHALRHSLASTLLEKNTPLPIISEVLGHVNSKNTEIYLKIDINQLRSCSLEVPYETK